MFDKVFLEKGEIDNPYTKNILERIKFNTLIHIDKYDDIWGKVKKPYLHKRTNLNLFIAKKRGQLLKEAPVAYGHGPEKHYYYIHAYNCIYECQYCYLQGYFSTPDIVLFVNHNDIISEMENIADKYPKTWFHAGEFSDSLSLSHITNEFEVYFEFFKKYPKTKLELRTKSVNIRSLLKLAPLSNIYVSFTLSSTMAGDIFDERCPNVTSRLIAIKKLVDHGYNIGIHFDPIIYEENFIQNYKSIICELAKVLPERQLGYISIGVVRFTKDVYREVQRNYPESKITRQDYGKSFDGKIRYNRPMRNWILSQVKEILISEGNYSQNKVYLCMEEEED